MARARYDELLAVGERWTVETIRNPGRDALAIAAGWQAVHRAARHHFGWLGQPLRALSGPRLDVGPDITLQHVADAIGAAGDLLALHAETTAALREDPAATADARRHLAALVSHAAYAAVSALETATGRTAPEVVAVRRQLERSRFDIARVMRQSSTSGTVPASTLARLTTSMPAPGVDPASAIASAAARWSRAHRQRGADGVVSRDLRATTAQQRTTNAMTAHIVGGLIATATDHRIRKDRVAALVKLQAALYQADRALLAVEQQWRRFASSGPGPSTHPAVEVHHDLADRLRALVRPAADGGLARSMDLVPDIRTARGLIAAADDLTQALAEVATHQASVAARLVSTYRLLVSRDARGRRLGGLDWVWLQNVAQAAPLLTALDTVVPLANEATRLSRIAAGADDEIRAGACHATPTVRPIDRAPDRYRTAAIQL